MLLPCLSALHALRLAVVLYSAPYYKHILEGESEVKRSESDKKSVKTNNMISITILFNGKSSIPRPKSQL
jgi:hypothetical protein